MATLIVTTSAVIVMAGWATLTNYVCRWFA